MSDEGIKVELIQLDVAFSVPVREEKLVQFSCRRNNNQKSVDSLLNGSTVKVHPLHQLPNPHDEPIKAKHVKGTISLRKDIKRWNTERNSVNIGNSNNDEWQEEDESRDVVCDLYRYQNNGEKRLHQISTYWNIVYSVKIYSTIAHWLLQTRSKFPLTEKQIFGIGNRSFIQLQSLVKNIGSVSKKGFAIVKKHGILSRIEFSIRPHHRDGLRTRGHYNDFLLHVFLAAHDLCMGTEYEFHFQYMDSLPTQIKVMTMISEALTYLRFSASNRFNMVYCNPRLTVWLRAHVSLLLITTGFAPEYGTKHLNNWLRDKDRWDPYERSWTLERPITGLNARLNGPQQNHTSLSSRTKEELRIFLSDTLHFSTEGIQTLHSFFDSYTSNLNPMPWYEKFSLLNKLRLSRWILDEIIPHLSQFMARKVGEKYKRDRRWNHPLRETQDPKEQFNELLRPSDTMTQDQMENTPLPTDPVSRSIHTLLQLGTFSDLHRPIFTILLFKFILRCHSDKILLPQGRGGGYLQLWPLEDRTISLLNKRVESGVGLSNNELQQLCALLKLHLVGANRKNDYYVQELCMKYHVPCAGVEFELKGIKNSTNIKKMNNILNDVMKSDLVMLLPSKDSTSKRYHRNTDNSTITIMNLDRVAQVKEPQLIPIQTCNGGYELLARCVNLSKSPHEDTLRRFMHGKITKTPKLKNKFLSSNGLCSEEFKEADSLLELETSKDFKLLMTYEITTISKSMEFRPEIILPMASLAYEMDIIFYNKKENMTYIHVHYQSRSITYKIDGLEVTPLLKCMILSLELNGEYSRNNLSQCNSDMTIRVRYNEISMHTHPCFDPGIFDGRKISGKNARDILPDLRATKDQTFLDSICKLMSVLGHTASDALESHDKLGLGSFLEELSSCPTCFTGFGTSVTEEISQLSLPLSTLAKMLRTTDPSQLCHKTICPIFCLKFKVLIAVIVINKSEKVTFFYGFNSRTNQVECQRVPWYNVLIDRRHAMYLYSTNTNTGFYTPSEGHPARRLSYYKTLSTKYSHLSDTCLMEILRMFKEVHEIELLNQEELQDHRLRPLEKTAIIHTHIESVLRGGMTLMELLQIGITHHVLMLIFPYKNNMWEACIVHHPLQNKSIAKSKLAAFVGHGDDDSIYSQHCIRGMAPVNCETGFYIILYMVIGHRTNSLRHFTTSISSLSTEDNLSHKVRDWVYSAVNGETQMNYIPNWLGQILQVNSTTL